MNKYEKSPAVVIERPRQVSVREIRLTDPRPGAAVAKSTLCAISSGTDMKTWLGLQPPEALFYPLVPGYENVGRVVDVMDDNTEFKVGDRVMINECRKFKDICSAWGGGTCYAVKDSCTMTAPFDPMTKIPDNVSDRDAVLAYLPAVALKGIGKIPLKDNQTVCVVGAGMVGISAMQIVKILHPSCRVVCIERNAFRRAIAKHYADYVFDDVKGTRDLKDLTYGRLADIVIECSGNPQVAGSVHQYLKEGGWDEEDPAGHIHLQGDYPSRIVWDAYNFWFNKNMTITMSCAHMFGGKAQILKWMSEGKFDTSHLPIEVWDVHKAAEAYQYKHDNGDDVFKIILDWEA